MKHLSMARVRQIFPRPAVPDVREAVALSMERFRPFVKPGMSVAVTAGSRGINNIPLILRTVAESFRSMGALPFIFASMGSHGGGTPEGQAKIFAHLGITEEFVGMPFRITSDTVTFGVTESGHTLYADAGAARADAVFVVNRVKSHTAFQERIASGLLKMITVGMGKVPGASQVHRLGSAGICRAILELSELAFAKMNILGGIALVENGFEETAVVEAFLPGEMETGEMRLLKYAKTLLPGLPLDDLDILIIGEIGKNFSGTGMDTNVVGRWKDIVTEGPIRPVIRRIVVLRLSEESDGNANGIGLADFTTKKLVDSIDWRATLMNVRTTGFWGRAFCPPFPGSDRDAIEWAVESIGGKTDDALTVAKIANTLHLDELSLNEAAFEKARNCERLGPFKPLAFNEKGDLTE